MASRNREGRRNKNGTKMLLAGVLVFLVLLGGVFLLGRMQARSEVRDLEGRVATAESATAQARQDARATETQLQLRSAQVALLQAAVALEERNFGTAETRVRDAGRLLETADAGTAGVDQTDLQRVRQAVQQINIAVAGNLQPQRRRVIAVAEDLDRLIGPVAPEEAAIVEDGLPSEPSPLEQPVDSPPGEPAPPAGP